MVAYNHYKAKRYEVALLLYIVLAEAGYEVAQSNVAYLLDKGMRIENAACFWWLHPALGLLRLWCHRDITGRVSYPCNTWQTVSEANCNIAKNTTTIVDFSPDSFYTCILLQDWLALACPRTLHTRRLSCTGLEQLYKVLHANWQLSTYCTIIIILVLVHPSLWPALCLARFTGF